MAQRLLPGLLLLAACSGGGGGGTVTITTPVRLLADALEIGTGADGADLDVALAADADQVPVLLQVDVELPSALAIATTGALAAQQTLPTLRGETRNGRYRIVCGDDMNRGAASLQPGPLFRLHLVAATPRQPGTYTVRLRELRAARTDGTAATAETAPTAITVIVR